MLTGGEEKEYAGGEGAQGSSMKIVGESIAKQIITIFARD